MTRPTGSPKYGTTRKNTPRYYTTKRLKRCISLNVSDTFNPIICKSKKKTNLFYFLTTFFKTARFEHENEMRRKALKHTHKFGIHAALLGIRNPLSWNPESSTWSPQCGIQNPRLSWIPLHAATHKENGQQLKTWGDR